MLAPLFGVTVAEAHAAGAQIMGETGPRFEHFLAPLEPAALGPAAAPPAHASACVSLSPAGGGEVDIGSLAAMDGQDRGAEPDPARARHCCSGKNADYPATLNQHILTKIIK